MKRWIPIIVAGVSTVAAAAPLVAQAKDITLEVTTWDGEDGQVPLKEAAADFMSLHPNVKIQIVQLTGDYKAKLIAQVVAGGGPQVFMVGDWDYASYAQGGITADLTPYLQRDKVDLNQYIPQLLDSHRYTDGKIYSLPKDFSTVGVYYNKDFFDQAGLAYPTKGWTWDDAQALSKKLAVIGADGKTKRYGLAVSPGWDAVWWSFAWGAGQSLMDDTFRHVTGFMDNEAAVNAMQRFGDLVTKYPDTIVTNDAWNALGGEQKLFQSGLSAMVMWGNWMIASNQTQPNLHWGTVEPPTLGAHSTTFIMEAGWGLNPNLKDPDVREAAWQLVKFLGTAKGQWHMSHALWAMTSIPSVAQQVGITSDPYYKAFFDAAYESMPTYWTKVPDFDKNFNQPWQKAKTPALSGQPLKVGLGGVVPVIEKNLSELQK
ncbi:MAG TPA: extracellular solute-binding protein [Limnochordia bacterium]|nr:extracellular solute-binding protein [Limnochordia bacterium]